MSRIARLDVAAYRIPTDRPEADGTLEWDSTGVLVVEPVTDDGLRGLGYSYTASQAAAELIHELLVEAVVGLDVEDVGQAWNRRRTTPSPGPSPRCP